MRDRAEIEKEVEGDVPPVLVQNIRFRKLLVELLLDMRGEIHDMADDMKEKNASREASL